MKNLTQYLDGIPAGPITNTAPLESLLAAAWDQFGGDDGGMKGEKLLGRMESVVWEPPRLSFRIERHGGTVNGSSRAELQHWSLDLEKMMATLERVGHRQLYPMLPRLDVNPLADEIAVVIANGQEHVGLKWYSPNRVRVLVGKILPKGSAVKQTLAGRRRRFWKALTDVMEPAGWKRIGRGQFEKDGEATVIRHEQI